MQENSLDMGYIGKTAAVLAFVATTAYGQYKHSQDLLFDSYTVASGQTLTLQEVGKQLQQGPQYQRQRPVYRNGALVGHNIETFVDYVMDVDKNGTPDIVAQSKDGKTVEQLLLNPGNKDVNATLIKRLGPKIKKFGQVVGKVAVKGNPA
jgi:hypothetical protein